MTTPDGRSRVYECGSPYFNEVYAEQSVTVIVHTTLNQLLEEGVIENVSKLVVGAVMQYCNASVCEVETSSVMRRLYDSTDLLSPVFDTSVTRDTAVRREVGGERGVAVSLYVEAVTHDGVRDVLTRTSTLAAVQECINDHPEQRCGGLISLPPPSLTLPPATQPEDKDTGLDIALVAGVTAAAAVGSLAVATGLALILYHCVICCSRRKSLGSDGRALRTASVSWPDKKGGGAREMAEVPPPPRMTEDPGKTVIVNPKAV
jgi:hypothetical protein